MNAPEVDTTTMSQTQMEVQTRKNLEMLPSEKFATIVRDAINKKPKEEKKQVLAKVRDLTGVGTQGPVSQVTRDRLWTIAVTAFSIVLVGSFLTLALGVFYLPTAGDHAVKPEIILSMFTSVVGFLAGLFVSSQANKNDNDSQD